MRKTTGRKATPAQAAALARGRKLRACKVACAKGHGVYGIGEGVYGIGGQGVYGIGSHHSRHHRA